MNIEPEEFEAGENVTNQVRRSKPAAIVVSVRLSPEDSVKLIDLAEASGKTVSQVAREAIRLFMSQSGQRPTFVPEITGNTPNVNIVAFAPLGPRTAKEKVEVTD
ncbi:MAG: CopG family transcriptional regulator [Chloroflexi bacterium]|nr:CopG family transcriptional regulator [Chloroflexota bacterium]